MEKDERTALEMLGIDMQKELDAEIKRAHDETLNFAKITTRAAVWGRLFTDHFGDDPYAAEIIRALYNSLQSYSVVKDKMAN